MCPAPCHRVCWAGWMYDKVFYCSPPLADESLSSRLEAVQTQLLESQAQQENSLQKLEDYKQKVLSCTLSQCVCACVYVCVCVCYLAHACGPMCIYL